MKFFFPDSSDMVDPSFDFASETRLFPEWRSRQRDYNYAHEVYCSRPPYDGILVSKSVLDSKSNYSSRYSIAQQLRFLREGVREFFRLDQITTDIRLEAMGDCGAFSYVRETEPPFSVNDVLNFYCDSGFDYGMSLDHIVLGYRSPSSHKIDSDLLPEWRRRQSLTLELAAEFISKHKQQSLNFTPIGVAQGWSPDSYARAVLALQAMGYRYIALGGMVILKTRDIFDCLEQITAVLRPDAFLHLLGIKVTRDEWVTSFKKFAVRSFDTTSPLRQAFKDDRDNYYAFDRNYLAIRVPQVDGTPKLIQKIKAGKVEQEKARDLEQRCLQYLKLYDLGQIQLNSVLSVLQAFEELHDGVVDRTEIYREILTERPWKICPCDICRGIGIQVMIFRGAERHKRRGFHNLFVSYQKLQASAHHAPAANSSINTFT